MQGVCGRQSRRLAIDQGTTGGKATTTDHTADFMQQMEVKFGPLPPVTRQMLEFSFQQGLAQSAQPVAWMVKSSYGNDEIEQHLFDNEEEARADIAGNGGILIPLYSTPPDSLAVAQALKQAEQECYRERDKADAGEWQDASGSAWALGFGFACNLLGKRIRALIPSDLVAEALPTAQALEKAESPEQDEKA